MDVLTPQKKRGPTKILCLETEFIKSPQRVIQHLRKAAELTAISTVLPAAGRYGGGM
jgi:hypothetical protein